MIYSSVGIFSEMVQAKHSLSWCNYDLYESDTFRLDGVWFTKPVFLYRFSKVGRLQPMLKNPAWNQCDQMVALFFNIGPFTTMETYPIA